MNGKPVGAQLDIEPTVFKVGYTTVIKNRPRSGFFVFRAVDVEAASKMALAKAHDEGLELFKVTGCTRY